MKQIDLDVKNDVGLKYLDDDHKAIFNYIVKLKALVDEPNNHSYSISILESFTACFLEHIIKEEQLLQQYLPPHKVKEHIQLHENELKYLDKSVKSLKAHLSSNKIETIALNLNKEFINHINRYDKNILKEITLLRKEQRN